MTSNDISITVWYFLINEHHRPIYDHLFYVDLPMGSTIAHLTTRIKEDLPQNKSNTSKNLEILGVWRCIDPTATFIEGDVDILETTVKAWFLKKEVRKLVARSKVEDLHIRDDESLLVQAVVTRLVWYLIVDHEMRPTSEKVSGVVATRILELTNCAEVKEKSRHGKVIVWRSTVTKFSVNTALEDLIGMIDQIDFGDHKQATTLADTALVTDADYDDVLIVQVLASDEDREGEDRLLPLPFDENLNEGACYPFELQPTPDLNPDYEKTYSRIRSVKSPSTNSKSTEYSKNQTIDRDIIYDGLCARHKSAPSTNAPPIHIYHPIFWQFTRSANDPAMVPDSDFLTLVRKFMAFSCQVGNSELTSNKTMRGYLKDILQWHIPVESNDNETRSDGVIMFEHSKARTPMAIAEFKRTLGEGGCDPSIQVGNSMRQKLGQDESKLVVDKCCCPVFMLAGGGPWLCVLGGVFINRFIVQRLTDMMWIGFSATHEDHRVYQVAKVLLALRNSLRLLEDFYEFVVNTDKIPDFNAKARDPHPRHFPYPHSFVVNEDTVVVFEYLGRLETDMRCVTFLAKIKNTGEKVVVKFVDRYGDEVHRFLAEQGHAPRLLYYGPLPERTIYDSSEPAPDDQEPMNAGYQRLGPAVASEMKMVVMEYIPQSKPRLDDAGLSHDKISAVLEKLHMNGYVFGDLRGPNIMFDANDEVKFIDFDWAGRYDTKELSPDQQEDGKKTWARFSDAGKPTAEEQTGFATYPIGISLGISWADGVGSYLPILPDHDTEMLAKLHERWLNIG